MVVTVHCAYCGAEKQVKKIDLKRRKNHFCNRSHYGKWKSEHQKGKDNPLYTGGNTKRICKNCGIEYEIPPSYVRNKDGFHSLSCYQEWRKKEAEKNKVNIECCICHKIKRVPYHRYKKGLDKTCSKKCEAILKSIIRIGKNNPNYREDADRGAYCIKFNTPFKEGVRVIWDYKCGLCEKTQSENIVIKKGKPTRLKLSVHHVHYIKSACCDGDDRKWDFIPLCAECHGKTNGDHKLFEEKCMDIIKNKMNGKTYMSETEYKEYIKTQHRKKGV